MWRGLSPSLSLLLLLGFTLRGLDALEETSTSAWRAKTQPMTEATVAAKAHREAASTSSSSTSTSSSSSSSTSTSSSSSTFTSSSSSSSSSTSSSSSPAKAPDSLREAEPLSPGRDAPAVGAGGRVEPPTAEPLEEDELDNQENVISQLLGDYDKVKTVSSGSDCVCRCTVRPIKRSDCGDGTSPPQSAYTVETVTKGTDCKKCTCMAPSSAVNPCEGEYRFKKLQEASKDDIKLATIIDLLEGSLYGLDLLKLQSVTTKLLSRMDNMEKAFTRNLTERAREKERAKDRAKEKEREKKAQQKKKKANDMANGGQKVRAPVHANKQKNHESQPKKNQEQQGLEQQQQQQQQQSANNRTGSPKPVKEKNSMVVKGVTFYKAEEIYKENDRGRAKNTSSWDLLISDQLPPLRTLPVQRPAPAPSVRTELDAKDSSRRESDPAPTQQPTTSRPATAKPTATTTAPALTTTIPPTTTTAAAPEPTTTTTVSTTTSQQTTTQRTTPPVTHHIAAASRTRPAVDASPTAAPQAGPKSRLSWTESPADRPKTTKKPGLCKDTVASISDPVQHNSYGLSDGAWMRDARGHGNVIYLTSGHYGNSLLEFREVEAFKSGQPSNSYKLPYSFTGTGHVVFNGAFYYNRAFSRDVIRYDLRHRYVAAWTTLHDALLEEQGHRTQTEVELAVDESGLWVLYPALDTEGFHQEVILLVHLHPRELQPIRTFRTGLRRGRYGNSFLVCGVLYAVDSMERRYANVTYAFDTHTLTHTVPSLAFMNVHGHTSQLAYCPLDKKLYAWDNGRQMTYDVVFAY